MSTLKSIIQPILKLNCNLHLTNKVSIACAWTGSYRIRNIDKVYDRFPKPQRWPQYNNVIQPPQLDPNEERRPATYYHYRDNIKSSPKKMWYTVKFIRGMSVDEAIKQLSFIQTKPAQVTKNVLLEAQETAVKDHNFQFKSDMWIEEALVGKGLVIKGVRKHARCRFGEIRYFYCHLLLKLTEGKPPKNYYKPDKDGNDLIKEYFDKLRSRKVEMGY